jgi:hypothetical protein
MVYSSSWGIILPSGERTASANFNYVESHFILPYEHSYFATERACIILLLLVYVLNLIKCASSCVDYIRSTYSYI